MMFPPQGVSASAGGGQLVVTPMSTSDIQLGPFAANTQMSVYWLDTAYMPTDQTSSVPLRGSILTSDWFCYLNAFQGTVELQINGTAIMTLFSGGPSTGPVVVRTRLHRLSNGSVRMFANPITQNFGAGASYGNVGSLTGGFINFDAGTPFSLNITGYTAGTITTVISYHETNGL